MDSHPPHIVCDRLAMIACINDYDSDATIPFFFFEKGEVIFINPIPVEGVALGVGAYVAGIASIHLSRVIKERVFYDVICSSTGKLIKDVKEDDAEPCFDVGSLVMVKPHAWPGTNCAGGIGHVVRLHLLGSYLVYDIKIVIGTMVLNIEADYVSAYSFE